MMLFFFKGQQIPSGNIDDSPHAFLMSARSRGLIYGHLKFRELPGDSVEQQQNPWQTPQMWIQGSYLSHLPY